MDALSRIEEAVYIYGQDDWKVVRGRKMKYHHQRGWVGLDWVGLDRSLGG